MKSLRPKLLPVIGSLLHHKSLSSLFPTAQIKSQVVVGKLLQFQKWNCNLSRMEKVSICQRRTQNTDASIFRDLKTQKLEQTSQRKAFHAKKCLSKRNQNLPIVKFFMFNRLNIYQNNVKIYQGFYRIKINSYRKRVRKFWILKNHLIWNCSRKKIDSG